MRLTGLKLAVLLVLLLLSANFQSAGICANCSGGDQDVAKTKTRAAELTVDLVDVKKDGKFSLNLFDGIEKEEQEDLVLVFEFMAKSKSGELSMVEWKDEDFVINSLEDVVKGDQTISGVKSEVWKIELAFKKANKAYKLKMTARGTFNSSEVMSAVSAEYDVFIKPRAADSDKGKWFINCDKDGAILPIEQEVVFKFEISGPRSDINTEWTDDAIFTSKKDGKTERYKVYSNGSIPRSELKRKFEAEGDFELSINAKIVTRSGGRVYSAEGKFSFVVSSSKQEEISLDFTVGVEQTKSQTINIGFSEQDFPLVAKLCLIGTANFTKFEWSIGNGPPVSFQEIVQGCKKEVEVANYSRSLEIKFTANYPEEKVMTGNLTLVVYVEVDDGQDERGSPKKKKVEKKKVLIGTTLKFSRPIEYGKWNSVFLGPMLEERDTTVEADEQDESGRMVRVRKTVKYVNVKHVERSGLSASNNNFIVAWESGDSDIWLHNGSRTFANERSLHVKLIEAEVTKTFAGLLYNRESDQGGFIRRFKFDIVSCSKTNCYISLTAEFDQMSYYSTLDAIGMGEKIQFVDQADKLTRFVKDPFDNRFLINRSNTHFYITAGPTSIKFGKVSQNIQYLALGEILSTNLGITDLDVVYPDDDNKRIFYFVTNQSERIELIDSKAKQKRLVKTDKGIDSSSVNANSEMVVIGIRTAANNGVYELIKTNPSENSEFETLKSYSGVTSASKVLSNQKYKYIFVITTHDNKIRLFYGADLTNLTSMEIEESKLIADTFKIEYIKIKSLKVSEIVVSDEGVAFVLSAKIDTKKDFPQDYHLVLYHKELFTR